MCALNSNFPKKTREAFSHHLDSSKWERVQLREGDIVVVTSYKSGTTWMQTLLLDLQCQGKDIPSNADELCPWIDFRLPPIEEQLRCIEHYPPDMRRQLKTHLRLDALKFSPSAQYIFIGRDLRDQFMSLANHYQHGNQNWYSVVGSEGLVGDPLPNYKEKGYDVTSYFDDWISQGWHTMEGETDGYPFWSAFDHVASWWAYRHLPNIMFIHFNDMLKDLEGSLREVAAFLNIEIKEEFVHDIVKKNTFAEMKARSSDHPITKAIGAMFEGGSKVFINKGTNGRWRDCLSEEQLKKFDEVVRAKLSPDCAAWIESGKASGIDPKVSFR